MAIKKLKERIKSLSGNMKEDKINKELEEIETINIELDHRVTKLIAENEHLKQIYKQFYDSIKSSSLKDNLSKLKGKAVVDDAVTSHPIDPELLKVDVAPLAPKLRNNRTVHSDYLRHTQEETATLREIVEQGRSLNPLNTSLDYAYTASVQHSKWNVKYDLQCVTCNGFLYSDNHDSCVLYFINNVNARVKSKSVKKTVKRKVWKPTGKVFINIRYIWRPTGRTFTIVGNACPLTRFTTSAKVLLRKPIALESNTPKPMVTSFYSRKLIASRNKVPVSKYKNNKSLSANKKEPNKSWVSIVSNIPSSSIDECSNDHVEKIMGYSDYQIGNVTILRVYFVEGLGHNLFSVGQFCDSELDVAFRQHTCFFCNLKDNGTEFVNQTLREYYEQVGISHETYVARSPQQNGVIERFTTAWYTQNRSIVCLHHGKTPYELLHNKPPDLSFFHVFSALYYTTNDSENLGKSQPKADIGIFIGYAPTKKAFRIYNRHTRGIIKTIHVDFDELTAMASEHSSLGPALYEMTPVTNSSRLVPNPPSSTQFVPPSRTDWDILFQPLFDELLSPPPSVDHPAPEAIALIRKVVA
nr:hypothetical protein [Tanacetum cinerariifolium]